MRMGLQFAGLSICNAEVVKLANTLRSGRSERELLRVRLPSSANLDHTLEGMIWVPAPKERGSLKQSLSGNSCLRHGIRNNKKKGEINNTHEIWI